MRNHLKETDDSRRKFIKLMAAGASLASVGGIMPTVKAQAKSTPKRSVPLPKFKVRTVRKTAAEIRNMKKAIKLTKFQVSISSISVVCQK